MSKEKILSLFILAIIAAGVTMNDLFQGSTPIEYDNKNEERPDSSRLSREEKELFEKYLEERLNKVELRATQVNASSSYANGKIQGTWAPKIDHNGWFGYRVDNSAYDASRDEFYVVSYAGHLYKMTYTNGITYELRNHKISLNPSGNSANPIFIGTLLANSTFRLIRSNDSQGRMEYSDDEGRTWNIATGVSLSQSWANKAVEMTQNGQKCIVVHTYSSNYLHVYFSYDNGETYTESSLSLPTSTYDSRITKPFYSNEAFLAVFNKSSKTLETYQYSFTSNDFVKTKSSASIVEATTISNFLTTYVGGKYHFYVIGSGNSVYYSADEGLTWTQKTANAGKTIYEISADKPNILLGGYEEMRYSTDYGATWNGTSNRLGWDVQHIKTFEMTGGKCITLVGLDFGCYVSQTPEDKDSYTWCNDGASYGMHYDGASSEIYNTIYNTSQDRGTNAYAGTGDDVYPKDIDVTDVFKVSFANREKSVWTWFYYGKICHHFNYPTGITGTASYNGLGNWWSAPLITSPDPTEDAVYAAYGANLQKFKYDAIGKTVSKITHPYDFKTTYGSDLGGFGYSELNRNLWYAALNNGSFIYSTDAGETWTSSIYGGAKPRANDQYYNYPKNQIVIKASKIDTNKVYYAGVGNVVLISDDGGKTFVSSSNGSGIYRIRDFTLSPDEKFIFAACGTGGAWIYSIDDDSWYQMTDDPVPSVDFTDAQFIVGQNVVRFTTFGSGVLDLKLTTDFNAPQGLNAVLQDDKHVELTWTDSSNSETGFFIERTNGIDFIIIDTVAANTTSYIDNKVAFDQTYHYRVNAIVPNIGRVMSNTALITVPFPNGGMIASYPFNNDLLDYSGYKDHGTGVNGIAYSAGKYGSALTLNGTDDYVQLPNGILNSCKDITVATWVKLNSNSQWNRLFDFGSSTNVYMFITPNSGSGTCRFTIRNSGSEQFVEAPYALSTGVWIHVAATLSNDTARLYINGILEGTSSGVTVNPFDLGNTVNNYIGKSQWPDPYFNGSIDNFCIYDYALSASELADLMAQSTVALPEISSALSANVVALSNFSYTITALNSPTSYAATGLPDGLSINTTSGAISGTPVTSGVYEVEISATNSYGSDVQILYLTVEKAPLGNGIVSYPFNNDYNDISGSANHASENNGVILGTGKYGSAAVLDGIDDYVSMPTGVVSTCNDITVAAWVNPDQVTTWSRVFDLGTGTTKYMFLTPKSGYGTCRFAIKNGGSEQIIETSALSTGVWTHVAVTLSGNTGRLYVNGVLKDTNTGITINPSDLGNTANNYIGKSQYPDPYLDGRVDNFCIYDHALSDEQITDLMNTSYHAIPQITSSNSTNGIVGDSFAFSVTAVNVPTSYTATGLPGGLSINTSTGEITGTPTTAGSYQVSITAKNFVGSDVQTLGISIRERVPFGSGLASYPFNDNYNDISGAAKHASENNGVTFATGKFGSAAVLDGTDDYISMPAGVISTCDDITVATWVKPSQVTTWSRIFDFGTGTTQYMILTPQASSGKCRFGIRNVGWTQYVDAANALSVDVWTHVAVTLSGNTARIYINGTLEGTNTNVTNNPSDMGSSANNYIGKSQWSNDPYFSGSVDNFCIYDYAMTDDQISDLANTTHVAIPQITSSDKIYGIVGSSLSFNVTADDASLGYSVVNLPSELSFDQSTGEITGTPLNYGSFSAVVKASNTSGSVEQAVTFVFENPAFTGLMAKYPFNGDLKDASEFGNDATAVNGISFDTGKFGSAAVFDGTEDYMTLPAGIVSTCDDITVAAWVKVSTVSTWSRIFDFGSSTNEYMFITPKSTSGTCRFEIKHGGTQQFVETAYAFTADVWTHVAVTLSGNTAMVYINGNLAGVSSDVTFNPSDLGNTTNNYIGKSQWPDPLFNGSVDNLCIYSTALTKSQIDELMVVTGGLFAKYPFDGDFNDASGSGNNATAVNGISFAEGKFGSAAVLNGSDDYMTLPTGIVSSANDITIATWVYLNSVSTWSRIFDFGSSTSVNMFLTPKSGSNTCLFALVNSGTVQTIEASYPLSAGVWTHVAVTLSGSTASLYINGTLEGTNTGVTINPSDLGNTTNNYIGKSQWPDPLLNGRVDNFSIYDTALTEAQINELILLSTRSVVMSDKITNAKETSFVMYPNPVSDLLTIETDSDGTKQVEIYDMQGKKALSVSAKGTQIIINLNELEKGVYFVRLLDGLSIETKMILKN